jgi:hypothetical protein
MATVNFPQRVGISAENNCQSFLKKVECQNNILEMFHDE